MSQTNSHQDLLFNSNDQNVPPIRADLELFPVKSNDQEFIYFHDVMGYARPQFVLSKNLAGLIALIDGQRSVNEIFDELERHDSDVEHGQILRFIRHLDENRILYSPYFKDYREKVEQEFEASGERAPICSGTSYPEQKEELEKKLEESFSQVEEEAELPDSACALYAPHIDPRVGMDSYVKAFKPLAGIKPKTVVILATSHYSGAYYPLYENTPFIATRKDFTTPFGTVSTDQQVLDKLEQNAAGNGLTFQDRAHRVEHSIELHQIFLQYLWQHDFQIVPILIGNFEELYYTDEGHLASQIDRFSESLREALQDREDVFYLISGDLAHIGKKFGDEEPAQDKLKDVKLFDGTFLEQACQGNREEILNHVKQDYDPYRICGFPPLYTFLKSCPEVSGTVTSYQIWDETERESAVSFGSIIYKNGSK